MNGIVLTGNDFEDEKIRQLLVHSGAVRSIIKNGKEFLDYQRNIPKTKIINH